MEGIKIIFLKNDENLFWDNFDKLNYLVPYVNAKYTRYNFLYYEKRYKDSHKNFVSESFMLIENNKPFFALVASSILNSRNKSKICAYENPAQIIEASNLSRSQKKYIQKHINKLVESSSSEFLINEELFNGNLSCAADYLISKKKFSVDLNYSYFIDLTESIINLKRNIRKSNKPHINWGEREMDVTVLTSENIKWNNFLAFRDLHIREAGRETRSLETWRKQYESVLNNEAFVIHGYIKDKLVSAAIFYKSKTHCYYSVAASRRDMFDKPLIHYIIWLAILHSKNLGILFFELGNYYPKNGSNYIPSIKEEKISHLKSGFGGQVKVSMILTNNN